MSGSRLLRWLRRRSRRARGAPQAAPLRAHRALRLEPLEDRRLLAFTLTAHDQLMLELINRARANPELEARRYGIDLNENLEPGTISPEPKQPLAPNEILNTAARLHSQDMLRYDFFSHTNRRGEGPSDRARKAGYPVDVGENITWFGQPFPLFQNVQPFLRHEDLFLSEGHRENMLATHWREVGVGVSFGQFENLNAVMVTEKFGTRSSQRFLTGVAYTDHVSADDFYSIGEGMRNMSVVAVHQGTGEEFTTTTSNSGGYAMTVPDGLYSVSLSGVGLKEPITVENVIVHQENRKLDFNVRSMNPGAVFGSIFTDRNDNGRHDEEDTHYAGWTAFLDANRNNRLDAGETTAETDEFGIFQFSGLVPGNYPVAIVPQDDLAVRAPDELPVMVEVVPGQFSFAASFAMEQVNLPPVAVDDEATMQGEGSITLDVLQNDSDPDDALNLTSLTVVSGPNSGTAEPVDGGKLRYTPIAGFVGTDQFTYTVQDFVGNTSNPATVTIIVQAGGTWQNPDNQFDVDGDGHVVSLDALWIITEMNRGGPRELTRGLDAPPPPFLDVSGDGFLSPIDAMLVLNELNRLSAAAAAPPPPTTAGAGGESLEPTPAPLAAATSSQVSAIDMALARWTTEKKRVASGEW